MIEHYKRLVSLVLEMHAEQATEDGTYDPQGAELAAILLAHQIRELERNQNALNQKESASDKASKATALDEPNEYGQHREWRIYVPVLGTLFGHYGWCTTSHAIYKFWPLNKYQGWTR